MSAGRIFKLNKNNDNKLGIIASISYRNRQEKEQIDQMTRGGWLQGLGDNVSNDHVNRKYANQGATYNFNTTWGGLLNAGIQFGKNRISIRNLYTKIFNNDFTQVKGWNNDSEPSKSDPYIEEVNRPLFTDLLQNKIDGQHQIGRVKLDWNIARTEINRNQKDVTYLLYFVDRINNEVIYSPALDDIGTLGRFPFGRGNYDYKGIDWN